MQVVNLPTKERQHKIGHTLDRFETVPVIT
jgi:hypothetical protein